MNINIKYIYYISGISFSCVPGCGVDGTNNVLVVHVLYNIILENTPHAHALVFY